MLSIATIEKDGSQQHFHVGGRAEIVPSKIGTWAPQPQGDPVYLETTDDIWTILEIVANGDQYWLRLGNGFTVPVKWCICAEIPQNIRAENDNDGWIAPFSVDIENAEGEMDEGVFTTHKQSELLQFHERRVGRKEQMYIQNAYGNTCAVWECWEDEEEEDGE